MADQSSRQLVIFTIAERRYALPIECVQEIIRYTPPRPIDPDGSWVRGVISLRGRIVRVHDITVRLGLRAEAAAHSVIVIVDVAGDVVGVLADAVEEVQTVEGADIEAVPSAAGSDAFYDIAKIAEDLVVIVDPAVVFAAEPPAKTARGRARTAPAVAA